LKRHGHKALDAEAARLVCGHSELLADDDQRSHRIAHRGRLRLRRREVLGTALDQCAHLFCGR
jgi:hypothetical protein